MLITSCLPSQHLQLDVPSLLPALVCLLLQARQPLQMVNTAAKLSMRHDQTYHSMLRHYAAPYGCSPSRFLRRPIKPRMSISRAQVRQAGWLRRDPSLAVWTSNFRTRAGHCCSHCFQALTLQSALTVKVQFLLHFLHTYGRSLGSFAKAGIHLPLLTLGRLSWECRVGLGLG